MGYVSLPEGTNVGFLTQPMAKRLKLSVITCLVGKISRTNSFVQGPLAE